MKQKRKQYSAAFKARVALAAIKGDKTLVELSEQFEVHSQMIYKWKAELLDGAADVFGAQKKSNKDKEAEISQLHARIGQLTVENDFLAKVLGK